MFWENGRRSENVEDRRGAGMPGGIAGGGVGVVVIALIAKFFGIDPRLIVQEAGQGQISSGQQQVVPVDPAQDKLKDFVSVVLADTEDTWVEIFRNGGARYQKNETGVIHRRRSFRVRSGRGFSRSVLLSSSPQSLYRSRFLPVAGEALWSAGRIRESQCTGSRSRSSRAKSAGHFRQGARGDGAFQPGACQPAVRSPGVASGLLCGHLGEPRQSLAAHPSGWRHGSGIECGRGHRRRSPSAPGAQLYRTGRFHPWQLVPARAVVQARTGIRGVARMRYLQGPARLGAAAHWPQSPRMKI
jgi:hypothetical protein